MVKSILDRTYDTERHGGNIWLESVVIGSPWLFGEIKRFGKPNWAFEEGMEWPVVVMCFQKSGFWLWNSQCSVIHIVYDDYYEKDVIDGQTWNVTIKQRAVRVAQWALRQLWGKAYSVNNWGNELYRKKFRLQFIVYFQNAQWVTTYY